MFWTLFFLSSKWWSEAQEKKRLVADPRDTKVKKKLKDLKLHPGFPNPVVAQAYLQPAVDQSDSFFSWGRPQLDMIKEYPLCVCVCVGWPFSSRKMDEMNEHSLFLRPRSVSDHVRC